MEVGTFIIIIWLHWLGDFFFQIDKYVMNVEKTTKNVIIHAITYTIPMMLVGPMYAIFNGVIHFLIDLTWLKLIPNWIKKKNKYVTIGFDQALHISILIYSYQFFV